jgi:hypothetical protein
MRNTSSIPRPFGDGELQQLVDYSRDVVSDLKAITDDLQTRFSLEKRHRRGISQVKIVLKKTLICVRG